MIINQCDKFVLLCSKCQKNTMKGNAINFPEHIALKWKQCPLISQIRDPWYVCGQPFASVYTALGTQLPVLLDLYSLHKCVCVSRWWLFNRGMQCPSSRQTALLFLQQREHVSSLSTQDVGLDLLKKKKAQPASPTPIIPIFQQEQWNTSPQPPPFPGASSTWFPQYYRVLRSWAIVSRPTCPLIVPMRIHTHTHTHTILC